MALGKQQFFFPFFLFANSRYILLGSLYTSYDLLSPLNGQSYPIKITVWVLGGAGKTLFRGIQSALRAQGELLPFCGRWKRSSPSPRASLWQSTPPAEHPSFR